jgi:predicted transposase YdaD
MTIAESLKQDGIRENQIQMVINCLKEGAQIDFISKVTGLSTKEINEIAQEHKLH